MIRCCNWTSGGDNTKETVQLYMANILTAEEAVERLQL